MNATINSEIGIEQLVEFFRKTINDDFGYHDVLAADSHEVLTGFLSPRLARDQIISRFLHSEIFDEAICSRIEHYSLKIGDWWALDNADRTSVSLHEDFVKYYHPDVIYSEFKRYDKKGSNLHVLKRSSLDLEQKSKLIRKGESWLPVLYRAEQEINAFWGWDLSNSVESVVAKVNPSILRDYVFQGKVQGFAGEDDDKYPTVGSVGMVVDGFEKHAGFRASLIPLVNAYSEDRFGHLIGKRVNYHFLGIDREALGSPYGELVAIVKDK